MFGLAAAPERRHAGERQTDRERERGERDDLQRRQHIGEPDVGVEQDQRRDPLAFLLVGDVEQFPHD